MKKVLVTGGAGFLGSHLCEKLLKLDCEVICVDNLFTGSKRNIIHLLEDPYFEFMRHDITVPLFIEVDEIYNLACPASPVHYQYDPVQTTKTSVHGSINLLDLAKRTNAKIFLASTSEVYGDPMVHPQSEDYFGNVNPVGYRACYDEGKRCAETLFFDYYREYNLKIKIARIFNTYGPRMHQSDGRVVSNFIIQAINNKDISIYGNGRQTRSFCYVDNMIDGLIDIMNSQDEFTGPVNLGNTKEITIIDLAKKIIKMTKSDSSLIYRDLPENDPVKRRPDTTLAEKMIDWNPVINLDKGLGLTIQYFLDNFIPNEENKDSKRVEKYFTKSVPKSTK